MMIMIIILFRRNNIYLNVTCSKFRRAKHLSEVFLFIVMLNTMFTAIALLFKFALEYSIIRFKKIRSIGTDGL
jgi:hypothetical protein